jgi:hypothetical protein
MSNDDDDCGIIIVMVVIKTINASQLQFWFIASLIRLRTRSIKADI